MTQVTDEDRQAAEVTQADRDAAFSTGLRLTKREWIEVYSAFARHREAAFNAGLERAAGIAMQYEGKPIRAAEGWSDDQVGWHEAGQLDASSSIATAIRAAKEPSNG